MAIDTPASKRRADPARKCMAINREKHEEQLPRKRVFTSAELALAKRAKRIAAGRPALFHGTSYPDEIIASDAMLCSPCGNRAVSFTSDARVAAYFSLLQQPREFEAAVLVFDLVRLCRRYKMEPFVDPNRTIEEAEYAVWQQDVLGASGLLLGVAYARAGREGPQPEQMRARRSATRDYLQARTGLMLKRKQVAALARVGALSCLLE